jgi:hypothetical protein
MWSFETMIILDRQEPKCGNKNNLSVLQESVPKSIIRLGLSLVILKLN